AMEIKDVAYEVQRSRHILRGIPLRRHHNLAPGRCAHVLGARSRIRVECQLREHSFPIRTAGEIAAALSARTRAGVSGYSGVARSAGVARAGAVGARAGAGCVGVERANAANTVIRGTLVARGD